MNYDYMSSRLLKAGFTRIERDDRLLDVFPDQTREKGVELWERWSNSDVFIVGIWLPYSRKHLCLYSVPRGKLAEALQEYRILSLQHYRILAKGEGVEKQL
jgi:hypothetical protein